MGASHAAGAGKAAQDPERGLSELRGAGQRVMYVDDEKAVILLARRLLTRIGYQVTAYSDPHEALAAFQADPVRFDAVITDLSMPHMTGFDLARALIGIRADLPLVMTSGQVGKEEQENALRLGIREILVKPASEEAFGQALARVLHKQK